jgi:hypothetical protein
VKALHVLVAIAAVTLPARVEARDALLEIDLTPGFMRHVHFELPAKMDAAPDFVDVVSRLSEASGCPQSSFRVDGPGEWSGDCEYVPIMQPPFLYDLTLRPSQLQTFVQLSGATGMRLVVRHRDAAYSTIPANWTAEASKGVVERSIVMQDEIFWPDVAFEVGYRWEDLPSTLSKFWMVWAAAGAVLLWPMIIPLRWSSMRYWGAVATLTITFAVAQLSGFVRWINAVGHHPSGLIAAWAALMLGALLTRAVARWGARAIKHPVQCWMPPVTDKLVLLLPAALMVGVFAVAPTSLLVVNLSVVAVSCCAILVSRPLQKLLRGQEKKLSRAELQNLFGPMDDRAMEKLEKLPGIPVRLWKDASRDEIRAYFAWCTSRANAPAAEGSLEWIWLLMTVLVAGAVLIFLVVLGRIPAVVIGWGLPFFTLAGGIWYWNWRPSRDRRILREAKKILGSADSIDRLARRLIGYWSVPLEPSPETVHHAN